MRARSKNSRLVAQLARRCVTQRQVARVAGLHQNTVSQIVNNRTDPTPATAQAIAAALHTTPARLGLGAKGGGA
ncbi:MAG: helix-turn-helix transcriptional regulator [Planctomycetes bacterium]|nr:helix-turn-helix transcriptional regulator [Planctomycetota bacterium]